MKSLHRVTSFFSKLFSISVARSNHRRVVMEGRQQDLLVPVRAGSPSCADRADDHGVGPGLKDERLPSDRIIRLFAHQNSLKILTEFRKLSQKLSESLKKSNTSQQFLARRNSEKNHQTWWKFRCNLSRKFEEKHETVWRISLKFWFWSGAKVCKSRRSWKMLKNMCLDAKVGVDTTENEPSFSFTFSLFLLFRAHLVEGESGKRREEFPRARA